MIHTLYFLVCIVSSSLVRRVVLYVKNDISFEELIDDFISSISIIIVCIISVISILLIRDDNLSILLIDLCYISLCILIFENIKIESKVNIDSERIANNNNIANKARDKVFNNTDQKVIQKSDINNQGIP